ncbi:YgiT-type zinc finger protein [Sphingobacteriales bacterium CHB3]|nr:YgiT-type zinc finger protein [Sphingobacteriales bacterium CHB3]
MKCTFPGCPGEYEDKFITHKIEQPDGVAYIDNVPAKVCGLCGDTILASETLKVIEEILKTEPT